VVSSGDARRVGLGGGAGGQARTSRVVWVYSGPSGCTAAVALKTLIQVAPLGSVSGPSAHAADAVVGPGVHP